MDYEAKRPEPKYESLNLTEERMEEIRREAIRGVLEAMREARKRDRVDWALLDRIRFKAAS